MFRRDYIQRQIQLIAEALARIAGLRKNKDLDGAEQQVAEAYRGLDLDPAFLRLDARSLASIVGDPERVRLLAQLLEEDAAVSEARGDAAAARQKRALCAGLEQWLKARQAP